MLPYEYSVILKAFEKLSIPTINIYLEASAVTDSTLNGKINKVSHYFNKRFYKYTEPDNKCPQDLESQMLSNEDGNITLYCAEGCMLPSKTELKMTAKGKFDLYTITNMSFMDIALTRGIKPNLYAVTKANLAIRDE